MNLSAILTALGGRHAMQQLLDVGPSAISNYLARGQLPERAKPIIYAALTAKGYQLRPDDLEIIASPAAIAPHAASLGNHKGSRILLIVAGGIAAYKALEVARQLQQLGAHVTGVMTDGAKQFITPLSLAALTGEKCYDNLFSLTDEAEMGHIRLARSADLVLVVPATANFMARANAGIADDLATTILLATTARVAMAPAMNPAMWAHPATQSNFASLRQRGVEMIGPVSGDTACGEEGEGRMCEPAMIAAAAMQLLPANAAQDDSGTISGAGTSGPLSGKHILITSGPTIEPIDKVRFIANRSSGKQGHAIAAALAKRGAVVTLISGPVTEPAPANVSLVNVTTADQMLAACTAALPADIAICAAAVADWRVKTAVDQKLKKPENPYASMTLELCQNPDILAILSTAPNRPKLVIGFAAETENLLENAAAKRRRKGCDWIIANQVGGSDDPVFGSALNQAMLLTSDRVEEWPRMQKTELAEKLADQIEAEYSS
ncbi:MAG: bifunctional phosphopantothenoylcysteine decarboxylase/phosphopantothenate--cysteine ligase CoaBC [Proteobacteria bacterium]|nr:bifunctional phosphopantothenoylcysteine decarboxylase/phosphopantothenate--cysteine ligase CoaBC [Pseudomonadota bacterium]MDA0959766.1 bifunctional phosphopantothenoylcysteine decarboxylase/phosphopantothenate--cysteine ligase CoaBC [Pseudomonadota bacterium]MDA1151853.1 bifunctional phosphopantothenoylcysteine decarboxylase/phosphopantothenate--cysteine ligase CoaBC [Pseudomonadota bacterium]